MHLVKRRHHYTVLQSVMNSTYSTCSTNIATPLLLVELNTTTSA